MDNFAHLVKRLLELIKIDIDEDYEEYTEKLNEMFPYWHKLSEIEQILAQELTSALSSSGYAKLPFLYHSQASKFTDYLFDNSSFIRVEDSNADS